MKEIALKYGCNPNQKPSRIFMTMTRRFNLTATGSIFRNTLNL